MVRCGCEQDRKMASLLGIDVDRTISITFVMGAALAAVLAPADGAHGALPYDEGGPAAGGTGAMR